MIKKSLATVAVAASAVGMAGIAATPAMAAEESELTTINGNGASDRIGNTTTGGYMSPNMALVNSSLNDICLPVADINKLNVGSVVGIVPITVQDLLTSSNDQTCAENSTQVDGDDPLANLLSDIPILSRNGIND
ncbi:RdlA protein [Streptomyces sp. 3MP-14]|uniref:RdlA protein n=1 Tax=Streptomyces mimosae TaxID=2586635 RepID=A0A5N6AA03_9ACTN|nr:MULTISPECIES: rodlin [Streptomyces]KAB8164338.1 RdlA protein [Streptomyces mimosae]KAB8176615.1 RdlA protein [Streptomyces sp. 3MP-14]